MIEDAVRLQALAALVPGRPKGELSAGELLSRSPASAAWQFRVIDSEMIGPRLLQVGLQAPRLAEFTYAPGQDLTVLVSHSGGRAVRRRYTVRRLDRAGCRLDLDIYLHGPGLGSTWAQSLRPQDVVEAIGPRGKITIVPDAEWHLFVGDETAVPAIEAMAEALPVGATGRALLEVLDAGEWRQHAVSDREQGSWCWLSYDLRSSGRDRAINEALAMALAQTPLGRGHIYLAGEAGRLRQWQSEILRRGVAADAISAKAYWGAGQPNATHGEPLADHT
jgi:NADPH-dependent ferric siderophore reductase